MPILASTDTGSISSARSKLVRDSGDYSWRFMRGRCVVDDLAVPRGLSFLLRSIEQWEVAMIAPFSIISPDEAPPAGDGATTEGEG
jgi:hypothetical protein